MFMDYVKSKYGYDQIGQDWLKKWISNPLTLVFKSLLHRIRAANVKTQHAKAKHKRIVEGGKLAGAIAQHYHNKFG